ncbi:MAG TPA: ABC transporter permease [Bryobacteraceae bacterium]|jgi:predicted permease
MGKRILWWWRRKQDKEEIEEELRAHLAIEERERSLRGASPEEARLGARRLFGNQSRIAEETRDVWRIVWLEELWQDVRYGVRALRHNPGFTAIALLTLAIGIGANTAIFSVVNRVLIQPLPYPGADRLTSVWQLAPGLPSFTRKLNCAPTMYFTYREQNRTFEKFGVWSTGGASVTGVGDPEQLHAVFMTYGVLDALGVQPAAGRWFSEADDTPGTEETVILTNWYWMKRFGGDASVVGRTLQVDSRPHRVIGVMPGDFEFPGNMPELLLPERFERSKLFLGNFSYTGLARLKAGVTIEQADADVARMLPIWRDSWPLPPGFNKAFFTNARMAPYVRKLKDDVVGDIGSVLWILMGTIGLVLLIACANVANLLLVRAGGRQQEFAIRAALGAGWGRIARELLIESLLLGVLGGALGLGLASASLRVLMASGPDTLPRQSEIGIDPLALVFALAVSVISGLLFGVIPVIKYAAPRIATRGEALRTGGRALTQSRERHRARNTLVVVQVALALVLLVGSGLMIRTFQALRNIAPGFTAPGTIQLLHISIPEAQVKEPDRVMRLQQEMADKLAAIPGVETVSFGAAAPLEGFYSSNVVYAQDKVYTSGEIAPIRSFRFVAPGYLRSVGTPLVAGRDLTWTDLYDKRDVAMVSENMAREMWGGPPAALGKYIREGAGEPWREVVGVAADVHSEGVYRPAPTTVYWPALMNNFRGNQVQASRGGVFLVRSSRAGTESFLKEARGAIWSVNANLPIFEVETVEDLDRQSMARTSFTLVMLAIAGGMALLLGIIGIYGVISYAVTQRTREIGIRMALGARPGAVQRMFVRYALILAAMGVALGAVAAVGLSRLMKSLLFEVSPLDPVTYVAVAVVLVMAAVLASYLPARRAAAVDPLDALRAE